MSAADQVSEPNAAFPVDLREGVIWAFRLLLGREPNDEQAIAFHVAHSPSVAALRAAFLESEEYQLTRAPRALSAAQAAVIRAFQPFCNTPAPAGSWHDFLGVRTRCAYLPDHYTTLSGVVQGPPGSSNGPMHDVEEWVGTLRSVLEARDRLVSVELGAGWAPWLVASAKAAERVGIRELRLIGVEGSSAHVAFMHRHLADNGIDPAAHSLLHAVVGVRDGAARFPKLLEPQNVYGGQAEYASTAPTPEMEDVPSLSLATLLADVPRVDILHCDIQGMEAAVFEAGREIVDQRVRRVVIGTHSRDIEARLLDLFAAMGWDLEDETACRLVAARNAMHLVVDGNQVWSNPKL